MTHTYSVEGMTCASCVKTVTSRLSAIPGITSVDVDLANKEATLSMDKHVGDDVLQQSLNGTAYIISAKAGQHHGVLDSTDEKVTLATYLPVFLIFGYILAVTVLIQLFNDRFDFMEWMSHFMAGFFLVFSFFKLLDVPAFAASYSTYDLIAKKWYGYGYVYPFLELLLGFGFLVPGLGVLSSWIALPLMSVSIAGVISSMLKKQAFQCACLGAVFKLPLSKVTLIEDALMILMSALTLYMAY